MNYSEETRFRYLTETSRVLHNAGFDVEPETDGSLAVSLEGNSICQVVKPGGITYRQENLSSPELERAKDQAFDLTRMVSEYMRAMDQGSVVKAAGLSDRYKTLADFNGTLLAATETRFGVQFVTWDWDFNREGLSHGHYFSGDYNAAKEDFVTRSNLMDKYRLFTPAQMAIMYRCGEDALNYGLDLTYEQEQSIKSVLAQIEEVLPDVVEQSRHQDMTSTQGLSM